MSQSSTELIADHMAPKSIEAEEAVLGSVLLNASCIIEAAPLAIDDFYLVRHQWIWAAMLGLADRGMAIDHLTVCVSLEESNLLAESGGAAYLISLINKTPSALDVSSYAAIVRKMALRRRLLDAAQEIARTAHADLDVGSLIGQSFGALEKIASISDRPIVTMESAISAEYDRRQEAIRRRGDIGERTADLPSGFVGFDKMTDYAYAPGVLAVIIALPKMGKTTIGLQIAIHAAQSGFPVLYATYEMAVSRLTTRAWAIEAGIPESAIREGRRLDDTREAALNQAMSDLAALPIQFVNTPIAQLQGDVVLAESRYGRKGLLVVDNINSAAAGGAGDNQAAQISDSLAVLDAIKLRTGFAILGLAHQRDDYNKEASMDKLRTLLRPNMFNSFGSRAPLRYGEIVVGLYRPDVIAEQVEGFSDPDVPTGCARLYMLANRYGPSDRTTVLKFEQNIPRFVGGELTNVDLDVYRGGE